MDIQYLDILQEIQQTQKKIVFNQRGINEDISDIIELQIKSQKESIAQFEVIKECFNKQNNELMELNYKLQLLKKSLD